MPPEVVKWVGYDELSIVQRESVRFRYKYPYLGYLYRTYRGQLTMTGNDRRRKL